MKFWFSKGARASKAAHRKITGLCREDIRSIAARHFQELPRSLRLLLRGLGAINPNGMQFVSYLLFESGFTSELIELGYRDAKREEEDIRAFIFDQPVGSLDAPGFIKEQIEH